jgi:hypothetical protein
MYVYVSQSNYHTSNIQLQLQLQHLLGLYFFLSQYVFKKNKTGNNYSNTVK